MRLLFTSVQILCFVSVYTIGWAQNNETLSMRTVGQHSAYYYQAATRVADAAQYTLQPGFLFTSLSLRIDADESFAGAYVVCQQDTLYLSADDHGPVGADYRQANLVILPRPTEKIIFYPATIRGEISFSFFNALGEKKSLNRSSRTEQHSNRARTCEEPPLILPDEWRAGLPEPTYSRSATRVSHVIIHHSATYNDLTDYENVVRNIYLFHTQSNGWSDIGYNYLVAPDGTIFAGRSAGNQSVARDNIQGAHFCGQNSGTMGVCLLGNYNTAVPSDVAINSIVQVVGWKISKEELNPFGEKTHPTNASLGTIAGHRNGCATECPGDNLYARLDEIRAKVANHVATDCAEDATVVLVYPIPVTDVMTVTWPDSLRIEVATLYDMVGRNWNIGLTPERPNQITWDTRNLATGVYVVHLSGLGWEARRKILVQ